MDCDPSAGFPAAGLGDLKRTQRTGSTSNLLCDCMQVTVPLWMGLSSSQKGGLESILPEALTSSIHSHKKYPVISKLQTEKGPLGSPLSTRKGKIPRTFAFLGHYYRGFTILFLDSVCRITEAGLGKRIHTTAFRFISILVSYSSRLYFLDPMLLLLMEWEVECKESRFWCLVQ